jgi:hypothetical protein
MAPFVAEEQIVRHEEGLSRTERLDQLERIVASSHFRNSKRYPAFLRFVVESTVAENPEVLKERNLGVEVFGRPSDYDTNADPIVRVTAGEVRKRIAQYYQTPGHEHELRIDLPLGSYVPHFYAASHAPPLVEPPSHNESLLLEEHTPPAPKMELVLPAPAVQRSVGLPGRLKSTPLLFVLAVLAMLALVTGGYFVAGLVRSRANDSGIRYFWQSFTPASKSVLVVIGVHSFDNTGKPVATDTRLSMARDGKQSALSSMENSDMVPLSDIVSYDKITDLLTQRSLAHRTKGSSDTTLDELRVGPVILIGGFDNVWTMRLTSALRYRLVPRGASVKGIEDSRDPSRAWLFDYLKPAMTNSEDYAIVASYYDPTIEQHVMIAAGIGMNGTRAAAEFLTTDKYMANWLAQAKIPPNKNVELVLSTNVLDDEPGPPHVVTYTTW